MNYEEFLLNISRDNNFKIIEKRYNKESFGNFEIICLMSNLNATKIESFDNPVSRRDDGMRIGSSNLVTGMFVEDIEG